LNPAGKNPFTDSKKLRKDVASVSPAKASLTLKKQDPKAESLWEHMNKDVHHRMDHLVQPMQVTKHDHPMRLRC
jgi:hypothetical protein